MPVENRTTRFDDVDMTYSSATGLAQNVTLFATPFFTKTAVERTALYAQDSMAYKRLTLTAGVRWERLERLPARAEQPGQPVLPEPDARRSRRCRDVVNWYDGRAAHQRGLRPAWATAAPRSSWRPAATTT